MNITPKTIQSSIKDIAGSIYESDYWTVTAVAEDEAAYGLDDETLKKLETEMKEAARNLDFERAASLRDRLKEIRNKIIELGIKESEKKGRRKKRTARHTD